MTEVQPVGRNKSTMPFIAFEGLDGSGKSTLIGSLAEKLKAKGQSVVVTREPGGTRLGDEIRKLLLAVREDPPVPRAELFLYEAARAQHVDAVIRPAIARGEWVLCDRFAASTLAFQCGGRRLEERVVGALNAIAVDGVEPDLWILLDLPVEESLKRRQNRGTALDRFEREEQDFHERVRRHYLQQASKGGNWAVIDATQSPAQLRDQVARLFEERRWL